MGADGGTGSTGAAASSDTLPLACDRSEESGSGWRECWRPFMAVLDSCAATTVTLRRVRTGVSRSRLVFVRASSGGGERPAMLLFPRRCSCSRASAAIEPQRCSGDERKSDESTPMHAARHAHSSSTHDEHGPRRSNQTRKASSASATWPLIAIVIHHRLTLLLPSHLSMHSTRGGGDVLLRSVACRCALRCECGVMRVQRMTAG